MNRISSPTLTALKIASASTTLSPTVNKTLYQTGPVAPVAPTTISVAPTAGSGSIGVAPTVVKSLYQSEAEKAAAAAQSISIGPAKAAKPAPAYAVPSGPAMAPSIPGLGNTNYAAPASGGGGGGGSAPAEQEQPYASPYSSEVDSAANSLSPYPAEPAWNVDAAVLLPNGGIVVTPPTPTTALAVTSGAAAKPSIWERILSLFGLTRKSSSQTQIHGESVPSSTLDRAAEDVVRRARAGEQVAIAIITLAKENADKGIPQAKAAVQAIANYCERNPVVEEGDSSVLVANDPCVDSAVRLSCGPLLSNPRIGQMVASCEFGEEEHKAMLHGFNNPRTVPHRKVSQDLKVAHATGRVLGMAKRLQAVRMHGSSISAFDPVVGWEFGE